MALLHYAYKAPSCNKPDRPPLVPTAVKEWLENRKCKPAQPKLSWPSDCKRGRLRSMEGCMVLAWDTVAAEMQMDHDLHVIAGPLQAACALRAPGNAMEHDIMQELATYRTQAMALYERGGDGILSALRLDHKRNMAETCLMLVQEFRRELFMQATMPMSTWYNEANTNPYSVIFSPERNELKLAALEAMGLPKDEDLATGSMMEYVETNRVRIVLAATAAARFYGGDQKNMNTRLMLYASEKPRDRDLLRGVLTPRAHDFIKFLEESDDKKIQDFSKHGPTAAQMAAEFEQVDLEAVSAVRHARCVVESLEQALELNFRRALAATSTLQRDAPLLRWTIPANGTVEAAKIVARRALQSHDMPMVEAEAIVKEAVRKATGTVTYCTRPAGGTCTNKQLIDVIAVTLGSTKVNTWATVEALFGGLRRLMEVDPETAATMAGQARTLAAMCADKAHGMMAKEMKLCLAGSVSSLPKKHIDAVLDLPETSPLSTLLEEAKEGALLDMDVAMRFEAEREQGPGPLTTVTELLSPNHRHTIAMLVGGPMEVLVHDVADYWRMNNAAWAAVITPTIARLTKKLHERMDDETALALCMAETALAASDSPTCMPRGLRTLTIPSIMDAAPTPRRTSAGDRGTGDRAADSVGRHGLGARQGGAQAEDGRLHVLLDGGESRRGHHAGDGQERHEPLHQQPVPPQHRGARGHGAAGL